MTDSPRLLVLADLDDSLFSTLRKIPASQRAGTTLAARASAGSAAGKDSFMTPRQSAMLDWMDLSRCVPVTARGTDAYSRVTIPFAGPAAILANGAVMLDATGKVDEQWAAIVNDILQGQQETITALADTLLGLAAKRSMDIRSWAVMEPTCGAVYAVAKSNDSPHGEGLNDLLEDLKRDLINEDSQAGDNWLFHINGNNLSVTPSGISKAIAVKYLLTRLQASEALFTVGIGDSASDLEFMRLCDVWMTPTRSQIDQKF
ncbi:MAG: HAD hydrolase family protein [Granulosicoccus sp.]